METTKPGSTVLRLAAVGVLVPLLGAGCPLTDPDLSVWCGSLAVHEAFTIPTARPVEQDFPPEQRCTTLVECGGTTKALVLDADGRCTVLVDFPTPEQGTVLPGSRCESGRNRIGGMSRDLGIASGGTVTLRDGGIEADIDWEVVISYATSEHTRVGATQHYTLRNGAKSADPGKQDTELACRDPGPPPGPEDFSSVVGCASEDFVVRTEANAERVVRFGNELGARYAPRCLSIAVGQAVRFEGPFSTYSMSPRLPESLAIGAPYNPITYVMFNTSAEFSFPRAGDYIYSNSPNASRGMTGLIRVR
jgi:plastocyanin